MRYQHKWQDVPSSKEPPENQRNLEATIRRSLRLGIDLIETARGYSLWEWQLAMVFHKLREENIPRAKRIVQSKIAPTADPKKFVADFNVFQVKDRRRLRQQP